jgi:ABC-type phosphate transport system auxiliary subunit
MNLSPDLQRFLPYIAVAVLAVVGVFLVTGVVGSGGGGTTVPEPSPSVQRTTPQKSKPGDTSKRSGGEGRGREQAPPKRTRQAYLSCVQQATNTAALERCQAFLPRS